MNKFLDWYFIQLSVWYRVDYYSYLNSKKWKSKRIKALKCADYQCQICTYKYGLHVHHNTYIRLGFERQKDLIVVCSKCHKIIHTYLHPGRNKVVYKTQREILVNKKYGIKI